MKCSIGGIEFDNVNMAEAVAAIVALTKDASQPHLVCTANLDHLAMLQKDESFRTVYNTASFVVADGMPIVWLSKVAGLPLKERVAGSDLVFELARESAATGLRLFFLGGRDGAANEAAKNLRERYGDVQIVGTHCPPKETLSTPEEEARIYDMIQSSKPDILFVGFGAPKQEKWIAAHQAKLGVPVAIGVGASFEMAAGHVQRAPMWMRKVGMEWLFRLFQEPGRLAKRYLGSNVPYLFSLYLEVRRERKQRNAHSPSNPKPNILA